LSNVFTLCIVRDNEKILVQKREKHPFKGFWNAPGGKVELKESPTEACLREVFEETGLQLNELKFRGVMTISNSTRKLGTEILMLFESNNFEGEIISSHEGQVDWIDLDTIYTSHNVPDSMTYILPYIVDCEGIITGKLVYNKNRLEVCDISLQA
jgi:8-oxo-dGTP diphosphatase